MMSASVSTINGRASESWHGISCISSEYQDAMTLIVVA
jgi:hypothetical protein